MSVISRLQSAPKLGSSGVLNRLQTIQKTGTGVLNRLTAPPAPSIGSKIIQGVKDYAQESADVVPAFGEKILHPIDTLKKGAKFVAESVSQNINKAGEGLATMTGNYGMAPTTGAEKIAGAANLITGSVGVALTPVTTAFEAAGKIPGAKQVADVVALPFTVTGKAGEWVGSKAIDILPVSQEVKDTLKQPISELTSLAAQIYLGGKITKMVENHFAKNKTLTKAEADKIAQNSKDEVLYHGTSKEAASSIMKEGFDPNKSQLGLMAPKNVYFTNEFDAALNYAKLEKGKNGQVIPVKIDAPNVKKFNSMGEYMNTVEKWSGKDYDGNFATKYNAQFDAVRVSDPKWAGKGDLIMVGNPKEITILNVPKSPIEVGPAKVETKIEIPREKTKKTMAEYSKEQGYEPVILNEKLPVIEMGSKPKETLPVIDIAEPKPSTGSYKYEPIPKSTIETQKVSTPEIPRIISPETPVELPKVKSTVSQETSVKPIPETPSTTGNTAPVVETPTGQMPDTTGPKPNYRVADENTVTKLANDYNEQFVGLSEAEKLSNREAVKHAEEIAQNNYEFSKQIVEGKAVSPANIPQGIMYEAIARKAMEGGDEATYNASLKKSDLAASRSGMELQGYAALENRSIYTNPVSAGKFLRKERLNKLIGNKTVAERLEIVKKEYIEKMVEAKKKVTRTKSKQSLAEFIKEIKC